ncbi:hypothetical protein F4775DRAFT_263334 [Biscogniauxia sp. FL1348]|nr:hypothetical protein F4775DRAFT_263334 [Biscogniauxia sp. FL1348]
MHLTTSAGLIPPTMHYVCMYVCMYVESFALPCFFIVRYLLHTCLFVQQHLHVTRGMYTKYLLTHIPTYLHTYIHLICQVRLLTYLPSYIPTRTLHYIILTYLSTNDHCSQLLLDKSPPSYQISGSSPLFLFLPFLLSPSLSPSLFLPCLYPTRSLSLHNSPSPSLFLSSLLVSFHFFFLFFPHSLYSPPLSLYLAAGSSSKRARKGKEKKKKKRRREKTNI